MKTRHGESAILIICLLISGCSQPVFLEVRNDRTEAIVVRDFKQRLITILPGESSFFDPGGRLVIEKPKREVFDLIKVPGNSIKSSKRRAVVYAIVTEDSLYLAEKTPDGRLLQTNPQPEGFPLKRENVAE